MRYRKRLFVLVVILLVLGNALLLLRAFITPERLRSIAEEQLEGAVAMHNLLARQGFAYLADEVGMGKTYVALGAVALLRYLNPGFRVLYIAPRENIQR